MKKNIVLVLIAVILVLTLAFIGWNIFKNKESKNVPVENNMQEVSDEGSSSNEDTLIDPLIQQQLDELDALRQTEIDNGVIQETPSEETIAKQLEELDALQENIDAPEYTEEDIAKQLEELEALRNK